jgi:nucleotidyltransferase substrate binding protein (TIGR01987 family)
MPGSASSIQGNASINGARDATREAFAKGLVADGDVWMEMIKSRNLTSHTYNKGIADQIVENILKVYITEFHLFQSKMQQLSKTS